MKQYVSKYSGEQIEEFFDQIANGEIGGGITTETDPIFSASPAASITEEKKVEWDNKVDKVSGKQLSTEDFTTVLKTKLEGLNNYDDSNVRKLISQKQDTITDLAQIREGARLGSTALQEHQDISHLTEKSEVNKVAEDVTELRGEVKILTGTGEGSVVDIANKEVAKVIDSAPETMDTLKKIADLIEKDAEQAADILVTLGGHENRISTLEDKFVVMSEADYDALPNKEDKFYFCYDE